MALQGPVDQPALQKRRLKAVRLFAKGVPPSEVARLLGVHRQSAGRWRKEWIAGGAEALQSKGRLGRRRVLGPDQMESLRKTLGASSQSSESVTLAGVSELIFREFGVRYHPGHVSRLLASMGLAATPASRRTR